MSNGNTPNHNTPYSKHNQASRGSNSKSNQQRRTSNSRPNHNTSHGETAGSRQNYQFMPPFTLPISLGEPNIRLQPELPPQPPTPCWQTIPTDAFVDFLLREGTEQHRQECRDRSNPYSFDENDLFSTWLGRPVYVEKYPLYSQAPELSLYSEDLVSHNRPSMEVDFLIRAHILYTSFGCVGTFVSSKETQNDVSNVDDFVSQRFQQFLSCETWIEKLGQQTGNLPGDSLEISKQLCSKVVGFTTLVEALLYMCWLGLYTTYNDQLRWCPVEVIKASCCVEARRWCLRILRDWAEDAHTKALVHFAPATSLP